MMPPGVGLPRGGVDADGDGAVAVECAPHGGFGRGDLARAGDVRADDPAGFLADAVVGDAVVDGRAGVFHVLDATRRGVQYATAD